MVSKLKLFGGVMCSRTARVLSSILRRVNSPLILEAGLGSMTVKLARARRGWVHSGGIHLPSV
ncbi:hypothetical protein KCP75_10065 [Salmonella enterica subsp. enterica]|nr:hypothetical protein KCP75_10065 [Salmonella enterica subsp. enterica]